MSGAISSLEEGLLQARSGDPRATATLESFVRDFPDNRRVAEAQLALAELVFAGGDMDSASHLLEGGLRLGALDSIARAGGLPRDFHRRFLAESPGRRGSAAGAEFLDDWPSSPPRPQVRMKLGELYFRAEDFANAQTQFETLAEESPTDPLADKALILAGQSSVRGMSASGIKHALDLFAIVAKGTGPLRLYARQEQALIEARRGHDNEAVIIYDDILRSNPDTALRLAALCGKADCLVAAANDASPAASPSTSSTTSTPSTTSGDPFSAAVALYDQIAADPDATAPWRNQALYKKGRCLNKQGFTDQALAALYDVSTRPLAAPGQQP